MRKAVERLEIYRERQNECPLQVDVFTVFVCDGKVN